MLEWPRHVRLQALLRHGNVALGNEFDKEQGLCLKPSNIERGSPITELDPTYERAI